MAVVRFRNMHLWLLTVAFFCVTIAVGSGFVLEGSQTSYAQFRKWNAGLNGSLEFEFKTEQPNGLLLYTDDGGTYDFFEIKLVEGALRLRYNLGGGAQILTVGRDLNDGHWHKVQVQRHVERTSLTVDGVTQSGSSRGKEFHFGSLASNSDVYVGGMPSWYNTKLTLLALPSVIFEPRFGGAIRNLVYSDEEGGIPRRQEMKMTEFKGIRGNTTDACEDHDPCQHGGICISTDSGPICECRNVDFEGIFCEKDKAPSEATFRGSEYLSYDLSKTGGEPIVSTQDAISLNFKTRQPSGLLFYTGDGQDYLNLALKDGGVTLTMNLGNGRLEIQIKPNRVRFDDNQWHKVTVHRKVQEISAVTSFCHLSAVVDGVYSQHSNTAGTFAMFSSSRVYVGGSQNTHALPGSRIHSNFVGCLRKVEFTADTLKLNLIDLGRTESKLITVAGHVDFMCQEVEAADPVTFTTRDSNLVLPPLDATRSSSISFKIRTNEPNGLLMYSSGASSSHADFFAFELLNGHIYLHLDLGSGGVRVKATTRRVDDGVWHEATLRRAGKEGRVTVDGTAADFSTPGESNQLDLEGPLYIGGVGPPTAPLTVPPVLWAGVLRHGYVGCMRDLVINGNAIDIAGYARRQDSGAIRPSCHVQLPQCDSQPCMNGGLCTEGWNRFICDCSATSFTGPTCGKDSTTLTFNGSQHVLITMPDEFRTQTEDVVLRFRTTRPLGLLLTTNTEQSADRLELALMGGRLRLLARLGDREKVLIAGQGLNNNQWHTLRFSRRGSSLKLQVDDDSPLRADAVFGKQNILEFRTMHVGGLFHAEEEIQMTNTVPNFVGSMQQFSFNGHLYFEMARSSGGGYGGQHAPGSAPQLRVTAKFGKRDHQLVHHPVTFRSKHTFVGLPVLKAYSATNIYFQFKTREPSGLILYNAGREQDFLAVELVNGHLHYIFNLGDGPVRVRDNARSSLNDNRWHAVTIGRPSPKQHTLMVDDNFAIVTSLGTNENLDLAGILYLGGVQKDMYSFLPKQIQSRQGYEGCLASLDLNGESPNLMVDAVVPSSQLTSGCEGPSTKCSHNICANRGVCVQQWNSYACDCDMTSYTGPTCSDESTAYEFGPRRGLITYTYAEDRRPEMKSDVIALGFITNKEDAILLRIDSGTSNDYMELEIVEGNIFMVYNMGTNDHPIGEVGVKVNDNAYHVIQFTRSGANSTIQVDDYNVQTNHPTGHQLSVFNSQAQIQIGGKWNDAKQRVERPFSGVMAGLVFNGLRLLDLASEKNGHISVRGDVQLMTGIRDRQHEPLQRMQQTPPSGLPGVEDDLVFSGAGSGCNADDEDECTPVFESGSGDDLITPVYVPPTRPPTTTSKVTPSTQCDDEDCVTGSGSGEITTEDNNTGTPEKVSSQHSSTVPDGTSNQDSTDSGTSEIPSGLVPGGDSSTGQSMSPSSTSGYSTADNIGSRSSSTTGSGPGTSSTSTTSTELPMPPAIIPLTPRPPRRKDQELITSEAAEKTALIIGIIAGAMIAIILIILIILKFKSRSDSSYKVDESKNYQKSQGPNAALLGVGYRQQHPQQMNGNLKNDSEKCGNKSVKKCDVKDVKEWYV
ncbi:neurexin-3 isoform X3 [Zootermopsis nevadensis]|uniref:neurexin-3 isoform X3 n=1 Tax=Zootermopsis nevadensis TaxID=136037 RepID=UPI000B8E96FD|nr:neurexin-3 isoform X3 [Zootermopsis nevadensis]